MSLRRRGMSAVRLVVCVVPVVMVAALLGSPPALAAPPPTPAAAPRPAGAAVVPASGRRTGQVAAVPSHFDKPVDRTTGYRPTATSWPAAARAQIGLAAPAGGAHEGAKAHAAATPVWAQALAAAATPAAAGTGATGPSGLDVRVLDRNAALAAGVPGVLFTVDGSGGRGPVRVGLDYAGFAQAYGGNYGSRLRLVQLPACAVSTPQLTACRIQTPVSSTNDAVNQTVSAQLQLGTTAAGSRPAAGSNGATVLAAAADPGQEGGAAGSYAATSLKPSGSWTAGGSTGSFSYQYPITVPPAPGLAPKAALAYDSSGLDGQTATTYAQSSWVGDGWSTPSSYVEQSFVSCADNPEGSASPVSTGDMCYNGPVLTLSLNGSSSSVVWDAGKSVWRPQRDDGVVVSHVTNGGNGTGTYNTDYWTVTNRAGTVYMFGRNQIPGWASGKPVTNSVDSEPVYSAHSGDPCYKAGGFAASVCTMAYRWNLDYVKDVHGNAMAYFYKQDTNFYGQDNGATNTKYVRDSHLDHIDYGFTDGNAYVAVPNQVVFGTGDRCVSGTCQPLNSANAANWPDLPFDLICNQGTTCASHSPSFFSTVRLASITTQQYSTASSRYVPVDSYTFTQTLPTPTDATSPTLWLTQIGHTGSDTTAGGSSTPITLPPVTFTPIALANRVNTVNDGLPPLYRYRIQTITTETGSVITAVYDRPYPCSGPVTISPASNTSSCYPVYWTPQGYTQPYLDWFNKYVVTKVEATDPTGGAPSTVTTYSYSGGAGWHFDDNEVVQAKYRTYGQFRGYLDVKTFTGDGINDPQTESESLYYRGMSKNNNATVVNVTDSAGGAHEDRNELAGETLEAKAYLGSGGPVDHSTITSFWVSAATATRNRTGLPPLNAAWVAPAETWTRQAITDGGTTTWRYTETDTSYHATVGDPLIGTVAGSYSHTVPADPAYDRCTTTSYAPPNAGVNLVGLAAEVETDSVACGGFTEGNPATVPAGLNTLTAPASVNRPAQVVSNSRTFYDDPTFATTFPQPAGPTQGQPTMVRKATDYTGGAFTYQTTSRSDYDSYGRQTAAYDGNGNKTSTAYTMNAVGLTTATAVTNPLSQTSKATLDPLRGLALTSTDPNNIVTTRQYDAFGRVTALWLASRSTSVPANYTYIYQLSNTGVTAVITNKLNDALGWATSTVIYDGQLRVRQTQTGTGQGGRLVSDTIYDSHGWVTHTNNGWWDCTTTPRTGIVAPAQTCSQANILPNQDFNIYDGLGRKVQDNSAQDGVVKTTTTTIYNGDRTTVIPPQGGITQATVTDPIGRTTELDQYSTAPTVTAPTNTFTGLWSVTGGTTSATGYGYDSHGNQTTVTDAHANTWTSTYNLLGQVTGKNDPDAGTSSMLYDAGGNLTQTTDARGKTISYTYDPLNRKTGQYDAPLTGQNSSNQLAAWGYDNTNNAVAAMTNPIGHLTTATAYHGGAAYTTQQTGFNTFGASLGQTITIPGTEPGLAGSYTFTHNFNTVTGLPWLDGYPGAGGLPRESVSHGYTTALELPAGLGSTQFDLGTVAGYAQQTVWDAFGRVSQETIGNGSTSVAYLLNQYDPHTSRLTDQTVWRTIAAPSTVDEQAYTYDPAGNITKQTSTRLGATTPTETQCYIYDTLDRLTKAWTATDSCAATPTTANHTMVGDSLGNAATYWTGWSLDNLGDRTLQTQHANGIGGTDTVTSYTYHGNGINQPHTLTATTVTGGIPATTAYTYDKSGNMTSRTTPAQGNQTLTWDDAGRLTAITGSPAGNTGFLYNADGTLLLQKDPVTTTLYLPGEQITLDRATGHTTGGTRYYPLPGGGTAIRTATATTTDYQFEITDQHGTPTLYLDNTAQNPTWRQYTPYGDQRGVGTTWPDNRGFLNKPTNTSTGLTELGARGYDPDTGRFISDDPVLKITDPQQLNGYSYSAADPIGKADPAGLVADCGDGGAFKACGNGEDGYQPPQSPPSLPEVAKLSGPNKSLSNDQVLTTSDGKQYRINARKMTKDELETLEYLNGQLADKGICGCGGHADGDEYLPVVPGADRTPDMLRVTWQGGKIVRVVRVDIIVRTKSGANGAVMQLKSKAGQLGDSGRQADEVVVRLKGVSSPRDEALAIAQQAKDEGVDLNEVQIVNIAGGKDFVHLNQGLRDGAGQWETSIPSYWGKPALPENPIVPGAGKGDDTTKGDDTPEGIVDDMIP